MHSLHMTQVLRHAESEPNVAATGYTKNYRTRNEGIRNRMKGVEGTFMKEILTPQPTIPNRIPSKKKEPKNFTQENIKRIRQMSQQRQLQQNGTKPVRGTWSANKYSEVPSKVFAQLEERIKKDMEKAQTLRRPSSRQTIASIQRTKSDMNMTRTVSSAAAGKPSIPNYVRRNSQEVKMTPLRSKSTVNLPRDPMKELDSVPKAKVGTLPPELQKNKDIRERAQKIISDAEEYGLPAGSYLMEENERRKLVSELTEAKVKKEREIFLLPVSTDTLRSRRKREELEKALREIDEGLNILSKPKVIIQDFDYVNRVITAAKTLAQNGRKSRPPIQTKESAENANVHKKSPNKNNSITSAGTLRNGQTKFYQRNQ